MKKLLVILFALGLVFAFSAPVMATDISFDGQYRVRGWYDSNSALAQDNTSNAYYDQRFRLGAVFQVVEGLKIITRFDAMDGTWGTSDMRGPTGTVAGTTNLVTGVTTGTSTIPTNNVQFDKAYLVADTSLGQISAGYMSDGTWGTGFGNTESFAAKAGFTTKVGNVYLNVHLRKTTEADFGTRYSDRDSDSYRAYALYMDENVVGGLLYIYNRDANDPNTLNTALIAMIGEPYLKATTHVLVPYFKATFGDLKLEAEATWLDGQINLSDLTAAQLAALNIAVAPIVFLPGDYELEGINAYIKAEYNLGSMYVGGLFAYVQGDDPSTTMKKENMVSTGGDWDPMLILFNDNCPTALGTFATTGTSMNNGYLYQVFAGTTIDKLSIRGSFAYAKADENGGTVAAPYVSDDYGTEFDLTASYKIYDNLTYTAGFGYLWAGDYYKGEIGRAHV